jgi:hypothetical protein
MEVYLGTMIRQVDSSLLDEWEKMKNPDYRPEETKEIRPPGAEEAERDITRDRKTFTAAVRDRIFRFLRCLVVGDFEEAAGQLEENGSGCDGNAESWTPERLRARMEAYRLEHSDIRLDPEGRNLRHTYVMPEEEGRAWIVQQMLVDPDDRNDWVAEFRIDLEASRACGALVMGLLRIDAL